MRTHGTMPASLILACGIVALAACDDGPGSPGPAVTPELFISTRFEDCGKAGGRTPGLQAVRQAEFSQLLHGTWVGSRTVRDGVSLFPGLPPGRAPGIHYAMIFDMGAAAGLAFEESSPGIQQNAFAQLLPPAAPGAPRMVYLHCAAQFRDEFVKVSGTPAAGLAALRQVTGVNVSQTSVADAWNTLRAAGFFAEDSGTTSVTGARFVVQTRERRPVASRPPELLVEMFGEYRSSAPGFGAAHPSSSTEGGVLVGVRAQSGAYMVGPVFNSTPVPSPNQQSGSASIAPTGRPRFRFSVPVDGTYRMVIGPLP